MSKRQFYVFSEEKWSFEAQILKELGHCFQHVSQNLIHLRIKFGSSTIGIIQERMRTVIQRVLQASVTIDHEIKSQIKNGLLVFVGIEDADNDEDIKWLSHKIANLRIFDDENKIPNLSLLDSGGDILLVSQFTLHASTKKGNRPSYLLASKADVAIPLYERMIVQLEHDLGKKIFTGEFGADMKVALVNDGPITIWMDTKDRQ